MNDDRYLIEEAFFDPLRKERKEERKRKQTLDRSKYKKTDLKKPIETRPSKGSNSNSQEGLVTEISSRGYLVWNQDKTLLCHLKGALKEEKNLNKNLVTIGDRVIFSDEGIIEGICPRRSELVRQDNLSRRKKQLLAANVDLVLITLSCGAPPLRPSLIDRYLIAAQLGHLEARIVINKVDLIEESSQEAFLLEEARDAYKKAQVPFLTVSLVTQEGVQELKEWLKGRCSVFSGPSGVGKSSILKALTGLDLKTGEVVERTKKGSHTTTNPKLIRFPFGGFTIDTPGIKSFGIWDLTLQSIQNSFSEFAESASRCLFRDCHHDKEEECQVKKDVEQGKISSLRYASYLTLLSELDQKYLRR